MEGRLGRLFTVDEAQTLLPVLGALMRRAREAAELAGNAEAEMQALAQRIFLSGGLHVDVGSAAKRRAEREKAVGEVRSSLEEIDEVGVRVGDLGEGRLEFPALREQREVLLCWRVDEEETIRWWREDAEGSELQPLDEGFRRERLQ